MCVTRRTLDDIVCHASENVRHCHISENLLGNIFAVYAQIPFRAHVVEVNSGEKRERTKTGELTLRGDQNWENNLSKKRLTGRTRG